LLNNARERIYDDDGCLDRACGEVPGHHEDLIDLRDLRAEDVPERIEGKIACRNGANQIRVEGIGEDRDSRVEDPWGDEMIQPLLRIDDCGRGIEERGQSLRDLRETSTGDLTRGQIMLKDVVREPCSTVVAKVEEISLRYNSSLRMHPLRRDGGRMQEEVENKKNENKEGAHRGVVAA